MKTSTILTILVIAGLLLGNLILDGRIRMLEKKIALLEEEPLKDAISLNNEKNKINIHSREYDRLRECIGLNEVLRDHPDERFNISLIDQIEAIKSHLDIAIHKEAAIPEKVKVIKVSKGVKQ